MTVYIDDAAISYGRMKMHHMIADTSEELNTMARDIGLSPRWIQYEGTWKEHYDVSIGKRALAITMGALPISTRRVVEIINERRIS